MFCFICILIVTKEKLRLILYQRGLNIYIGLRREEELTGEALAEMDFEELEDVCDDHSLDVDPDDYEEEDIEKFRKAIAKELGITLPKAKKETKAKGKKGKK